MATTTNLVLPTASPVATKAAAAPVAAPTAVAAAHTVVLPEVPRNIPQRYSEKTAAGVRAEIRLALADQRFSCKGIDSASCATIPIDQLRVEDVNCGLPLIVPRDATQFALVANDAAFAARLDHVFPALRGLDYRGLGLVLAGGLAGAVLRTDSGAEYDDADLFLVGPRSPEALERTLQAVKAAIARNISGSIDVYRSFSCVTFVAGKVKVQVVLRFEDDPDTYIRTFDLGSSAVLWDGERARVSLAGRIAYAYGFNVFNPAVHRGSYATRLAKYFDRGFGLLLPDLLVSTLQDNWDCLEYLCVNGARFTGGCVVTASSLAPKCPRALWKEAQDYYEPASMPYGRGERAIARYNLDRLRRDPTGKLCCAYQRDHAGPILAVEPVIPAKCLAADVAGCFQDATIKRAKLEMLIGTDYAAMLAMRAFTSPDHKPSAEDVDRACELRCGALHPSIPLVLATGAEAHGTPGISAIEWYGERAYARVD